VKRILVPLAVAPAGEARLGLAASLARAYGAELVLLHVLPEGGPPSAERRSREARALAHLEALAAPLHASGVHAHGTVVAGRDVAGEIVAAARELGVDLIVLGADVRGGLARTIAGSVADAVTRLSPVPVTLVQPDAAPAPPPAVRSFEADAAGRGPLSRWAVGLRTVEVARIVGSVGRAAELDGSFRSANRSREEAQRYARVRRGLASDAALPAVQLHKLGPAYYVLDGHHRVAAAHELGQLEIDAEVTEFVAVDDAEAQRSHAERRRFERETGVTGIGSAHAPDTWARLRAMVERLAAQTGAEDPREVGKRWYGEVYRPLVRLIQAHGVKRRFPGAHNADLAAMVDAFRECQRRCDDANLDWAEAVARFARHPAEAA
jgi:nucleotide-binding universal stress UspA family protein